jgi:geranylgeranyl diphosphate synthase type II
MLTFDQARKLAEEEIRKLQLKKEPELLYEPIRYVLGMGGKRIRPVLTLMCYSLFGNDSGKVVPAALAMELFHNFTLMHDDVMDNAALRRNYATVHVKWNQNVAILSGDAMLIKAYELLTMVPEAVFLQAVRIFNQTAMEVCEGQQMDMDFEKLEEVPVGKYLEMIRLKTSVLLAACMKIGAIAGGASGETADLLYEAGINVGLAFQLQDDLLDTFGDVESFGKEIGGDIRSNKKTYLYIKSLELASPEDRKILKEYYSRESEGNFTVGEKIEAVTSMFRKYRIDEVTGELIRSYADKALMTLDRIAADPAGKAELRNLFLLLLDRKS